MRKIIIAAILFAGTIPAVAWGQLTISVGPPVIVGNSNTTMTFNYPLWTGASSTAGGIQCEVDSYDHSKMRNCQLTGGATFTDAVQYFIDEQTRRITLEQSNQMQLEEGWAKCEQRRHIATPSNSPKQRKEKP